MNTTYEALMHDLHERNFYPVYYLMGEEAYYIDKVSDYIADNVLPEEERDFNQMVLYGPDVTMKQVLETAMRYPMMSEHTVIIVKEAQAIKATDDLEKYTIHPMPSTILVFCHKNGSFDKRKKLGGILTKSDNCVVFESNKLKDGELHVFIRTYLKQHDITIDEKSTQVIADSIGSDLNRLSSELDKLRIGIGDDRRVTPDIVEKHIGVSKDFNAFELRQAIVNKDVFKANQIVDYFAKNPKAGNVYSLVPLLFLYFANLMQAHYSPKKDARSIGEWLGVSPWMARDYVTGLEKFSARKTLDIIDKLRETDAKGKGLDNPNTPPEELMQELIYFILH
ncbi:MAG: DNA polymerase III subunit delta [Prevotellaceae bacterium]|nr:DNA polymerase III subunit delta [Prevotellaceae bacterium]